MYTAVIGIATKNRTPFRVVEVFELAICTVQVVVPPSATVLGVNALVTIAEVAVAGTVSTAVVP